jgi:F-type H+-transporting ATPase subunit delta
MNEGRISIRYANALYALAVEKGAQEEVYAQMTTLAHSFIQLPKISEALSNPMYSAEQKINLLVTAAGVKISALVKQFIEFVVAKGREEYMVFMSMSFQDIYRKNERIVEGKISSTVHLPEETLNRIVRFIKIKYRQKLELTTHIDHDLIGGFVMEVNNFRFDASLKTELANIQKNLYTV